MAYDGISYTPGKNSKAIPWQQQFNRLFKIESFQDRFPVFNRLNKQIDWHRDEDIGYVGKHRRMAGAAHRLRKIEQKIICESMFYRASSNRTLNVAYDDIMAGVTGWDLSLEDFHFAEMRGLSAALRNGAYTPDPFRRHEIPKSSGGKRVLHIPSETDRIVQRAILLIVGPYLNGFFTDFSFGWRPKIDRLHALAAAGWLANRQKKFWLVVADVKDAFPSTPVQRLFQLVRKYLYKAKICNLIELTLSTFKKGLPQGSPISPMLLNIYLHHNIDQKWNARQPNVPMLRYGDDILLICESESEARAGYDGLRRLLNNAGLQLKHDVDSSVVDSTSKISVDWLGFAINFNPLTVRIGETAWDRLDFRLRDIALSDNTEEQHWQTWESWLCQHVPALKWEDTDNVAARLSNILDKHGIQGTVDAHYVAGIRDKQMRTWTKAKSWACARSQNNQLLLGS